MHIHILGICGTFMGSLALLAKAAGHRVTGADLNIYPPMSTQLEKAGIDMFEGFGREQLDVAPDVFVVGNVISRGNLLMEAILNRGLPYTSGPQWLAEHLLRDKWVLAVSGTHGKTTTSSMLAWVLEYVGMAPGFLIGGVPGNFGVSARLGETDFFVIEADEYDTAFFDKRSKFIHYSPRTLVVNNLEYDHADIFPDLASIQRQFHHLVRTVPGIGAVIHADVSAVQEVLAEGCWSECQSMGQDADWCWVAKQDDVSQFSVQYRGVDVGEVCWGLGGAHNADNAVSVIAAARHVGVDPSLSCEALNRFGGVKRRMELLIEHKAIRVYDDFAHHPTAIKTTLTGLRAKVGSERIIAIIEPRSNTMKQGVHKAELARATEDADEVLWYQSAGLKWDIRECLVSPSVSGGAEKKTAAYVYDDIDDIIAYVCETEGGLPTHVVIMSNGGFDNIHQRLVKALAAV